MLLNISARLMGLGGMPEKDVDEFVLRKPGEDPVDEHCPWPGLTVDEVIGTTCQRW